MFGAVTIVGHSARCVHSRALWMLLGYVYKGFNQIMRVLNKVGKKEVHA